MSHFFSFVIYQLKAAPNVRCKHQQPNTSFGVLKSKHFLGLLFILSRFILMIIFSLVAQTSLTLVFVGDRQFSQQATSNRTSPSARALGCPLHETYICFSSSLSLLNKQCYGFNMARLFNKKPIHPLLYKGMVERTFHLKNGGIEPIKTLSCLIARIGKLATIILIIFLRYTL